MHHRFDLWFAMRQTGLLTLIVLAPVLLFAALRPDRRRWLSALPALVVVWTGLFFSVVLASARVWGAQPVPMVPLPIGPSYLSLVDMARLIALTAWLPTAFVLLVCQYWRPSRLRA